MYILDDFELALECIVLRWIPIRCLPVCLSVCLSFCLSVCLSGYLSVSQSVSQSVCLSVCMSVCLSVWLADWLSDCLPEWLPIWLSPDLFIPIRFIAFFIKTKKPVSQLWSLSEMLLKGNISSRFSKARP